MHVFGFGFEQQPAPPSSEDLAKAWRPLVETCVEAFGQSFTEPDDDWQPVAIVQASEGQSAVVPLLTLDKDLWMPLLTKLCAEVKAKRIALVTSAWILRMHKDQYMDPDYVPDAAGIVKRLTTPDETSLKLMELGFGPGEMITFLRAAPMGGPIEVELMGYRLCIRRAEGDKILVIPNP